MLPLESLVVELLAVYRLAAGAISLGEVTTLDHKGLDDTVESGALVVERDASLADALLAGAEGAEVLGGLGHQRGVQLHDDAAGGLAVDGDVEVDTGLLVVSHACRCLAASSRRWKLCEEWKVGRIEVR